MHKSQINYLSLYRGDTIIINENIEIHVPTLREISDYGESKYYSMVNTLCAVGIDMCWQLEDIGIDFEEISDFKLFYSMLCVKFNNAQTKILFGDKLDFTKMIPYVKDKETEEIILIQKILQTIPLIEENVDESKFIQIPVNSYIEVIEETDEYAKIRYKDKIGYIMPIYISQDGNGKTYIYDNPDYIGNGKYEQIVIDRNVYFQMIGYLRAIHNLKRDDRVAGTKSCKRAFIEDARMEYEALKQFPHKSNLLPLVSTMVNMSGFKHDEKTIWDMNIFAFMDSVKRISKIIQSIILLQSGYSGFGVDLKKIKSEIDYMGELD